VDEFNAIAFSEVAQKQGWLKSRGGSKAGVITYLLVYLYALPIRHFIQTELKQGPLRI
jgi:hypothetical protein